MVTFCLDYENIILALPMMLGKEKNIKNFDTSKDFNKCSYFPQAWLWNLIAKADAIKKAMNLLSKWSAVYVVSNDGGMTGELQYSICESNSLRDVSNREGHVTAEYWISGGF